ncbi:MAG: hypothetical protein ACRC3B_10865 [Bacteroidia bacterium]
MKKLACFIILALSFSVSANAQVAKGNLLAGINFSGRLNFTSGTTGFISIHPEFQYMFSKRFSAGLTTQFALGGYTLQNGRDNLLFGAKAAPELRFWFANSNRSRFSFYVYANAGYSSVLWRSDNFSGTINKNYFSAQAGVGALFWATPNTAIQARVNVLQYTSYDKNLRLAPSLQLGIVKRISVEMKVGKKSKTIGFQ